MMIFNAGESLAASISFPQSCWKVVDDQHLLIRGDRSSSASGARLWNLEEISSLWSQSKPDSNGCLQAIYKQAVTDGKEYWDGIGAKYHCKDPNPATHGEVCTRAKGYADNEAFLKFIDSVLSQPQGSDCAKAAFNRNDAAVKLSSDVAAVVGRATGAATAGAQTLASSSTAKASPKSAKAKTAAKSASKTAPKTADEESKKDAPEETHAADADSKGAEANISKIPFACSPDDYSKLESLVAKDVVMSCGKGMISQLIDSIWELAKGLMQTAAHPIGSLNAAIDLISEFRRDPDAILRLIVSSYFEAWPKDSCQSPEKLVAGLCTMGTKIAFDVLTFVTPGGVAKVTASAIKFAVQKSVAIAAKTGKVALGVAKVSGKVAGAVIPKVVKEPVKGAVRATAGTVQDAAAGAAAVASKSLGAAILSGSIAYELVRTNGTVRLILKGGPSYKMESWIGKHVDNSIQSIAGMAMWTGKKVVLGVPMTYLDYKTKIDPFVHSGLQLQKEVPLFANQDCKGTDSVYAKIAESHQGDEGYAKYALPQLNSLRDMIKESLSCPQ